ncbi:unnamed protein product [Rangifer tarandus platyrhynchus]|uniref:Uncharacterized protein n=1 Tax=Rangifer tarandus platyrhynchus TaxID=3082113 RepID=A0ABN8ZNZ7_RANTA|nr:unnamed protein product [Rangifer tarandus platyrhynchus]
MRENSRLLLGPQTVPKRALQTPSRASRAPVPPGPGVRASLTTFIRVLYNGDSQSSPMEEKRDLPKVTQ